MAEVFSRIGVIGAGAWGTALATMCADRRIDTVIWAHEKEVVDAINGKHENTVFLKGVKLADGLRATNDIAVAAAMDMVLLVTPAQHLRAVTGTMATHLSKGTPVVICSKGIEETTGKLMTEVLAESLPEARPAVLSGPTLAGEIGAGKPTAVTLAAGDMALAEALSNAVGAPRFRPYAGTDIVGAEVGGAVKNVLAIACGMVAGRGLGQNARAALMTRGLAEMTRFALAKGGQLETMMGLSGLGDLVLTCTAESSRNYSLGFEIGQGKSAAEILSVRRTVAEGAHTAGAVIKAAKALGVEMPICDAVNRIVHGGAALDDVIEELQARPFQPDRVMRR